MLSSRLASDNYSVRQNPRGLLLPAPIVGRADILQTTVEELIPAANNTPNLGGRGRVVDSSLRVLRTLPREPEKRRRAHAFDNENMLPNASQGGLMRLTTRICTPMLATPPLPQSASNSGTSPRLA